MKILIVNGYSSNYNGQKRFDDFVAIIKDIFQKMKQQLVDMPEMVIRDANNLDDYLYEPNSKFQNKEAEKMFDYVDFVFIDGDGNLLPWQKKCQKLAILFKMCKKTNKCMLAAGFGMQMLVYYCATYFTELQVINNNEKGGSLQAVQDVPARILPTLERHQVYLDNLTGDYYQFDQQTQEWKPQGNVGLHYSRAMASLGGLVGGDLIKKVSTYQSKENHLKPVLFYSKLTDVKCNLKKQYISHPLMQGIPQEFVVENRNTWDPHPVNITNIGAIETNYDTLAESDRGPQIVIHMNTVAVQFHIDKKYKESVQVINNYIQIKLNEIQNRGKIDRTLDEAYLRQRQLMFNSKIPSRLNERASVDQDYSEAFGITGSTTSKNRPFTAQASQQKMTFTKEFKHSGMGYSKRRGAVVVDNNAVSQATIKASTFKDQNKKWVNRSSQKLASVNNDAQLSYYGDENMAISTTVGPSIQHTDALVSQRGTQAGITSVISRNHQNSAGQLQMVPGTLNSSKVRPLTSSMTRQPSQKQYFGQQQTSRVTFREPTTNQQSIRQDNTSFNSRNYATNTSSEAYSASIIANSQKPKSTLRHLRNYQIEKEFKDKLRQDADDLWKNQKEIRQMLHPTLCEEFLPEDRDMTTKQGLLSASRSSNTLFLQKQQKNVIDQTPSRTVFCRFKHYQQMPQYSLEVPVIRNASPYVGGEEEQMRKRETQGKGKWLEKDFKVSFGKATTNNEKNYIKNYVTASPSDPPLLHKFRQEIKQDWLKGPFKF